MPKPFTYKNGEKLSLMVEVIDATDSGNIVVSVGGQHVPLHRDSLDAADQRPASEREPTDEEIDRARLDKDARAERKAAQPAEAEKPADKPAAAAKK